MTKYKSHLIILKLAKSCSIPDCTEASVNSKVCIFLCNYSLN